MSEVPFGLGILNEGEIVTSPEKHRLIAKRAWMQLYNFLAMNDEAFKALRIPVPYCLENDQDIHEKLSYTFKSLGRFQNEDSLRAYIMQDESHYDEGFLTQILDRAMGEHMPRRRWIFDQVMARNPKTVLDIGTGYGELAVMLGREGVNVTGLNVNPQGRDCLNKYAADNGLPVEVIDGVFEYTDFGETKFDVVVAGEVLEHVKDDMEFVMKCCDLANDMVVLTTPVGSCESGFIPDAKWKTQDAHVRSYSHLGFERLVESIPGFEPLEVSVLDSVNGHRGQQIECFCVVLKRTVPNDQKRITAEPVAQLQGDEPDRSS